MAMAGALTQVTQALSKASISCSAAPISCPSSSSSTNRGVSLTSSLWCNTDSLKRRCENVTRAAKATTTSAVLLGDDYEESEEDIQAAYEALYGPAFGAGKEKRWEPTEDKDGEDDSAPQGRRRGRGASDDKPSKRDGDRSSRGGPKSEFEERVVQIRRVTKVVKGGKQLSFRAVVIVGDKKGKVGVGCAKAKEVITAVQKSSANAKRNLVTVPMTKYKTFPHRADGNYGAAHVVLRPASVGTGVIAGGSVRVVLELAGVENALGKQIGSENPLNNARAVVEAVTSMKQFREVARDRGIPMEELWK
ncbi:hypothetical protein R1flu_009441 [Riccia fluitans]|uniref:Small ribosomal subunit protein uS5c n=1 Tax=Riccia fluitans TaxID=41844 RepID=A0ABD1Z4M5_9MARC